MVEFAEKFGDIPQAPTPVKILLVEDNVGDIELIRIALKKTRLVSELTAVENGEDAIKYLLKEAPFEDSKRPDLVLLDINLPKLTGLEVLDKIKTTESTRALPVIMLTSFASDEDINESYRKHANSYILKPVRSNEFFEIIEQLEKFWLSSVTLPKSQDKD